MDELELKDFGQSSTGQDPLIPTTVLAVLLGFCIALFRDVGDHWGQWMDLSGVLCGAAYLIGFMLYLSEYYDQLWAPYFMLPVDRGFFRLYSVMVGIVTISLMHEWPHLWPVYITILFLVLYFKKRHTLRSYEKVFLSTYAKEKDCTDNVARAKLTLAREFTYGFLKWGVLLHAFMSIVLLFLYYGSKHADSQKSLDLIQLAHVGLSFALTVAALAIWWSKINSDLRTMAQHVAKGDYSYFNR